LYSPFQFLYICFFFYKSSFSISIAQIFCKTTKKKKPCVFFSFSLRFLFFLYTLNEAKKFSKRNGKQCLF